MNPTLSDLSILSNLSIEFRISFEDFLQDGPDKVRDKGITIRFYTDDGMVVSELMPSCFNMGQVKRYFSQLLRCSVNDIEILFGKTVIPPETLLKTFQADNYGNLHFKLVSRDENFKIPIERAYKSYKLPKKINVKVEESSGEIKDLEVEIENSAIQKPFLGGYRDIIIGTEYRHGYSQTGPPPKRPPIKPTVHRDTQTYYKRNRKCNTDAEKAIQVPATKDKFQLSKQICVPAVCDKFLTPGKYETLEERGIRLDIIGKATLIQRSFRAWKTRNQLKVLSEEYHKRLRLADERNEKELEENLARKKRELACRVFPWKSDDFGVLYSMLECWRKKELARIAKVSCGSIKHAESILVFDQEMEIIQTLERLKSEIKKELDIKRIYDFFKEIGKPIEWDSDFKNFHLTMDTLEAQKGREYFDIYKDLIGSDNLSKDELVAIYTRIKEYLVTHECEEATEINSLIDRMFELMANDVTEHFIGALKKRIKTLVLHHFKLEGCNQGVTSRMNRLADEHMLKNIIWCQSCQSLKQLEASNLYARLDKIRNCAACNKLNKADEPWIDFTPHKFMLNYIRNYERLHFGTSAIPYIVKERDIHLIVNTIWHCHSAISECDDIDQLLLVRWKRDEEWAPWNCILITREEAIAHLRIPDVDAFYEEEFINHIFNKHALARKSFKDLKTFAKCCAQDPKRKESSVIDVNKLPPCKCKCCRLCIFENSDKEGKKKEITKTQVSDTSEEETEETTDDESIEVIFERSYTALEYDNDYI